MDGLKGLDNLGERIPISEYEDLVKISKSKPARHAVRSLRMSSCHIPCVQPENKYKSSPWLVPAGHGIVFMPNYVTGHQRLSNAWWWNVLCDHERFDSDFTVFAVQQFVMSVLSHLFSGMLVCLILTIHIHDSLSSNNKQLKILLLDWSVHLFGYNNPLCP